MSRNWTGAPGPEPLGIRAAIRRPVQRYRLVPLRRVTFGLYKRFWLRTEQWWPSIHGTPIVQSTHLYDGPANGASWTTYAKLTPSPPP